ncbi:MAG: hypothetical protein G8345_12255 [Magnetococcales bacterium]|nr:hypothetical protein [Magnetococcales bacterium]NGZ27645.1 hypothetical protein [Magnetococcales bacterium]
MAKRLWGSLGMMAGVVSLALSGAAWADSHIITYKDDVKSILEHRCLECHKTGGDGAKASGLLMDSYTNLMKGTSNGSVITPGNPSTSNLLVLVEGKAAIRMPHNKKPLTKCEIDILRKWIAQGAKDN